MSSIAGLGRIGGTATSSPQRSNSSSFKVPARADTQQAASAAPAAEIGGLLAMQELGGSEVRDREARRRGQAMLHGLAALQRALLAGQDDADALRQLSRVAEGEADAADPTLLAALRATRLRAQVELARRGL